MRSEEQRRRIVDRLLARKEGQSGGQYRKFKKELLHKVAGSEDGYQYKDREVEVVVMVDDFRRNGGLERISDGIMPAICAIRGRNLSDLSSLLEISNSFDYGNLGETTEIFFRSDEEKNTLLHHAVISGNMEILETVLRWAKKQSKSSGMFRGFLDVKNADSKTALHIAALNGDCDIVEKLMSKGAGADKIQYQNGEEVGLLEMVASGNIDQLFKGSVINTIIMNLDNVVLFNEGLEQILTDLRSENVQQFLNKESAMLVSVMLPGSNILDNFELNSRDRQKLKEINEAELQLKQRLGNNITDKTKQKIICLAICDLVKNPDPNFIDRYPELLYGADETVVNILREIKEGRPTPKPAGTKCVFIDQNDKNQNR